MAETPLELLVARMADLRALQGAIAVLSWDQETCLPAGGSDARGEQLATLSALLHERLTSAELGDALAGADGPPPAADAPEEELARAAMLRELRRDRDRAARVPLRLVRELAETQSRALVAWRDARERRRFALFGPSLDRLLALRREMAAAVGVPPGGELYDALLDGNEEGMRVSRLEPLFAELVDWLTPLVHRLARPPDEPDPLRELPFPADAQWSFSLELLDRMGFDPKRGRLDRSAHPFTSGADPGDVRLTTRIVEGHPLSCLFSVLHEGGHGLYEQGLPAAHRRDVLCGAASVGLHESQSRLWENVVGRSLPFWRHFFPRLAERWPGLAEVGLERFHAAVNRVERSAIRVDADEVTYNLHIALRFSLELALLRGELPVADLPDAWNARMQALLGITPRDDAEGVLQDIHWAWGELAYFPTYTIGNLYAATLAAAARRDLPDLDELLARGELLPLRGWLRDRVHRHGRLLPAEEIVRRAAGHGLRADDFRRYLESKYAAWADRP